VTTEGQEGSGGGGGRPAWGGGNQCAEGVCRTGKKGSFRREKVKKPVSIRVRVREEQDGNEIAKVGQSMRPTQPEGACRNRGLRDDYREGGRTCGGLA